MTEAKLCRPGSVLLMTYRRAGAVLGEPMAGNGFAQTLRSNCLIVNIIAQLDNQRCKTAADCISIFEVGRSSGTAWMGAPMVRVPRVLEMMSA
jgi:hypothetical protein